MGGVRRAGGGHGGVRKRCESGVEDDLYEMDEDRSCGSASCRLDLHARPSLLLSRTRRNVPSQLSSDVLKLTS